MGDKGYKKETKAEIILAQDRFMQDLRTPHSKAVWGRNVSSVLKHLHGDGHHQNARRRPLPGVDAARHADN